MKPMEGFHCVKTSQKLDQIKEQTSMGQINRHDKHSTNWVCICLGFRQINMLFIIIDHHAQSIHDHDNRDHQPYVDLHLD